MTQQNCTLCEHFRFERATPTYSEWTPGDPAEIRCTHGVWELDLFDDDDASFRRKMQTANTCMHFKAVQAETVTDDKEAL